MVAEMDTEMDAEIDAYDEFLSRTYYVFFCSRYSFYKFFGIFLCASTQITEASKKRW